MEPLTHFHFIRPWALTALIVVGFIYWRLLRQMDLQRQYKSIIRPHLLKHLTVHNVKRSKIRPAHILFWTMTIAVLAFAGPTWKRQPSPFTEDTAALIIVLDLSETMNTEDIQPSRLERAKQKIRDLLELRAGARTGLICYAGSAHSVMPLTDDASIIETYLESVNTDIMPVKGKNTVSAMQLAQEMLSREQTPGSILFITDEIESQSIDVFIDLVQQNKNHSLVLAIGTEQGGPVPTSKDKDGSDSGIPAFHRLDSQTFQSLSRQKNIDVTRVTVDDSDVTQLNRRIQRQLAMAQSMDENMDWQDNGYWLVYPLAAGILFWFRRGWLIQWNA